MKISEIQIGMLLDTRAQNDFDYIEKARVEAVAFDWFVARNEKGEPIFIDYGSWNLWEGEQT